MGFWDNIKRWKLAQQGLSSGKKRRVYDADERISAKLDGSIWLSWVIYVIFLFGMQIITLADWPSNSAGWKNFIAITIFSITAIFVTKAGNHAKKACNASSILLLGGILLQMLFLRLICLRVDASAWPQMYKLLLMPFTFAPIVHAVLLGRREATFSSVFVSICGCLLMPTEYVVTFMVISLVSGMTATVLTYKIRRRAELLRVGLIIGALSIVLSLAFGILLESPLLGSSFWLRWVPVVCCFSIAYFTALFVSGFLPLLESAFSTTTNISWLELGDLNHPLLKRLQLNAPGTFHHSLVMASLAEAAAEAIGANAAMCRACAYFHDVGKLSKPDYFIENLSDDAENPHNALTPNMSALVIIAHVKDGVDLALKHKLNHRIIDAILEHHGDTLVYYFYRKAQEQRLAEEEKVGKGLGNTEDLPYVDEKNFRYPGPRPRSKETGILSLADAIESASRTIKKPTPLKIKNLVDEIVKARWSDGQLDDCPLTMSDLNKIKDSFAYTLRSMLHNRISYKTEDQSEKKSKSDSSLGREIPATDRIKP